MNAIKITKKELDKIFPRPSEEFKDVYINPERLDSLKPHERKDFVKNELIKVGGVDPLGFYDGALKQVENLLEIRNIREDFVKIPKTYKDHTVREDFNETADLIARKSQALNDKYFLKAGANDTAPVTIDFVPKAQEDTLESQIRLDLDYINMQKFNRDTNRAGKEVAKRYRLNASEDLTEDFEDFVDPIDAADKIRRYEEIISRLNQAKKELTNDIWIRNAVNDARKFLIPEIKRLKGMLMETDFSHVDDQTLDSVFHSLKQRKIERMDMDSTIDMAHEKLNSMKAKYFDNSKKSKPSSKSKKSQTEKKDLIPSNRYDLIKKDEKRVLIDQEGQQFEISQESLDFMKGIYGEGDVYSIHGKIYYKDNQGNAYRVAFT